MHKIVFSSLFFFYSLVVLGQEYSYVRKESLNSIFTPVKIIDKNAISRMGANTLADVLKMELNIEVENFPSFAGSYTRVSDLNSKYFKILIDGIPIASRDAFGENVDISAISMYNVNYIEIVYSSTSAEYGNGVLSGIVNVVTIKPKQHQKVLIKASVQEESVSNEYNIKSGSLGKGRHMQNMYIGFPLLEKFTIDINADRNKFNGFWNPYKGSIISFSDNIYKRGYRWSPREMWNIDSRIAFASKNISVFYKFSYFNSDLTVFGRSIDILEDEQQRLFIAMNIDYADDIQKHHFNTSGSFWNNGNYSFDLSFQKANNKRKISIVRIDNNIPIEDYPSKNLYSTATTYTKGKLRKPIIENELIANFGIEMIDIRGFMAADQSTYQTKEINKNVFSMSEFLFFQWSLSSKLAFQPGIRFSHTNLSKLYGLPFLNINYTPNINNNIGLSFQRTTRFPNHRELYTYLENDFYLLEGNPILNPEIGKSISISWLNGTKINNNLGLKTQLVSSFKHLKNRIIIGSAPLKIPTQDAFIYSNINEHYSWVNEIQAGVVSTDLKANVGFNLIGTKGNDISNIDEHDKFLFHTELKTSVIYNFSNGFWVSVTDLFVSKQRFYSFEVKLPSIEKIRVYNESPSYNITNINAGKSFFNNQLQLSLGVKNIFNVNEILFKPTDGKNHYSGDLRKQNIDYGRSFYMRVSYEVL